VCLPAAALASETPWLAWPESTQEITDGSTVELWEDFELEPHAISPCEATEPAGLLVNGESVDRATAASSVTWYECRATTVTGGFTALALDPETVTATAEPAISIGLPDGCVYHLHEAVGHLSYAGHAEYTITGVASLQAGVGCSADLDVEGYVALAGPQAGGYGPVLWRSVEGSEREQREREARERVTQEQQRREREAKEVAERGELEKHDREDRENRERREQTELQAKGRLLTRLETQTVPTGKSAIIHALLEAGHASVVFDAPAAGELVISWHEARTQTFVPAHSHEALIAQAKINVIHAGAIRVNIRLTKVGRRVLIRHRRIAVTDQASFTATGQAVVANSTTFVLTR
jgi:hypothetical protein